jgi:hypothetical protein
VSRAATVGYPPHDRSAADHVPPEASRRQPLVLAFDALSRRLHLSLAGATVLFALQAWTPDACAAPEPAPQTSGDGWESIRRPGRLTVAAGVGAYNLVGGHARVEFAGVITSRLLIGADVMVAASPVPSPVSVTGASVFADVFPRDTFFFRLGIGARHWSAMGSWAPDTLAVGLIGLGNRWDFARWFIACEWVGVGLSAERYWSGESLATSWARDRVVEVRGLRSPVKITGPFSRFAQCSSSRLENGPA